GSGTMGLPDTWTAHAQGRRNRVSGRPRRIRLPAGDQQRTRRRRIRPTSSLSHSWRPQTRVAAGLNAFPLIKSRNTAVEPGMKSAPPAQIPLPGTSHADTHPGPVSAMRATVDGKFFRLGGRKFPIKGVTYGPFAPN